MIKPYWNFQRLKEHFHIRTTSKKSYFLNKHYSLYVHVHPASRFHFSHMKKKTTHCIARECKWLESMRHEKKNMSEKKYIENSLVFSLKKSDVQKYLLALKKYFSTFSRCWDVRTIIWKNNNNKYVIFCEGRKLIICIKSMLKLWI